MEDYKETISIADNIATWKIKMEGDIAGTYVGTFKFKCFLSPMQMLSAGKEYRKMLGEHHLTAPTHEANLAYALIQLKYRIVSAPPFWTSTLQDSTIEGDVADIEVIMQVLDAAMNAEILFKDEIREQKDKLLQASKASLEKILTENKPNGSPGTP